MKSRLKETVSATMLRVIEPGSGQVFLLRKETKIRFGDSDNLIGSVFMTNPGSFGFQKLPEWELFTQGGGDNHELPGEGKPDPTMRNVIRVIRDAYQETGRGEPDGIIRIYNLSNIVQPKGEQAERDHDRVKKVIERTGAYDLTDLVEPLVIDQKKFFECCKETPFVIMGFVKSAFTKQAKDILNWTKQDEQIGKKIVAAKDRQGWYSHPFRWNIEKTLRESAVAAFKAGVDKVRFIYYSYFMH